jgi:hypothetical protein
MREIQIAEVGDSFASGESGAYMEQAIQDA